MKNIKNWEKFNEAWEEPSWELADGTKLTYSDILPYAKLRKYVPTIELKSIMTSEDKDMNRVEKADYKNYPILVTEEDGEYTRILDGNHRVQSALIDDWKRLDVYVLNIDQFDENSDIKRLFTIK